MIKIPSKTNYNFNSVCPIESGFIAVGDHGIIAQWQFGDNEAKIISLETNKKLGLVRQLDSNYVLILNKDGGIIFNYQTGDIRKNIISTKIYDFATKRIESGFATIVRRKSIFKWQQGDVKAKKISSPENIWLNSICAVGSGFVVVGNNSTILQWEPGYTTMKIIPSEANCDLYLIHAIGTGFVAMGNNTAVGTGLVAMGNNIILQWEPGYTEAKMIHLKINDWFDLIYFTKSGFIIFLQNDSIVLQWEPGYTEMKVIPLRIIKWIDLIYPVESGLIMLKKTDSIFYWQIGCEVKNIPSEIDVNVESIDSIYSIGSGFVMLYNNTILQWQPGYAKLKVILSGIKVKSICSVESGFVAVGDDGLILTYNFPWNIHNHYLYPNNQRDKIKSILLCLKSFPLFLLMMNYF